MPVPLLVKQISANFVIFFLFPIQQTQIKPNSHPELLHRKMLLLQQSYLAKHFLYLASKPTTTHVCFSADAGIITKVNHAVHLNCLLIG